MYPAVSVPYAHLYFNYHPNCTTHITHTTHTHTSIQVPIRCCCFSQPDGDHIAVVLGGPDPHTGIETSLRPGRFLILTTDTLHTLHEGRTAKQYCHMCTYNASGTIFACCSQDTTIYLHDVSKEYKCVYKMNGHRYPVTHIDFSRDGSALRSVSVEVGALAIDAILAALHLCIAHRNARTHAQPTPSHTHMHHLIHKI